MYNFRTDLADERRDIFRKANKLSEIDGVETENEQKEKISLSRIKITNEEGAKALQKPIGTYVTIDIKDLRLAMEDEIQKASNIVSDELKKILDAHVNEKDDLLVVGLGNMYVTPDALGPKVVSEIDVTRHIIKYLPQYIDENARPVSAISPGVLGTTGIETLEVLEGIVNNIKPKILIVIDSLASKSIERINSTIQISDTGIIPGAGVGNKRKEISKDTLGIPVIAIGVPTVVELATLVSDGINIFIDKLQENAESNEYLNKLKEDDKYEEVKEALNVEDYNMVVTPKEIDELIENMKDVIARGINYAINKA